MRLIDAYDCALFDLDGVVYLGPDAVPGAVEGLAGLRELGVHVGYVTNNAARTPETVAEHLSSLGVPATPQDVVTSAQAGARMLERELPPGSRVMIVGTDALAQEVALVGHTPVRSSEARPAAVIQGYDPTLSWKTVDDACFAIQAGARWYATNTDQNRPTERGRVPGAGPQVAAVASSVDSEPRVAGKPHRPLLDETVRRLSAERPVFVGDRIDTDIVGAANAGMDSLFVFTGTHGKLDLADASPDGHPTHIGADLRALLEPPREVRVAGSTASCGVQRARVERGRVVLETEPHTKLEQLDALWAMLRLVWDHPNAGRDELERLWAIP